MGVLWAGCARIRHRRAPPIAVATLAPYLLRKRVWVRPVVLMRHFSPERAARKGKGTTS